MEWKVATGTTQKADKEKFKEFQEKLFGKKNKEVKEVKEETDNG